MDGVPDRAAINESVMLVKRSKLNRYAGFVNGILRSVQRDGTFLPNLNDLSTEQRLSVTCSVPKELVRHYIRYYGQDLTE